MQLPPDPFMDGSMFDGIDLADLGSDASFGSFGLDGGEYGADVGGSGMVNGNMTRSLGSDANATRALNATRSSSSARRPRGMAQVMGGDGDVPIGVSPEEFMAVFATN